MNKVEDKVIMYDSPEAARQVVMYADGKEISRGYLSADNCFFNKEEDARYRSHTHMKCVCGELMSRGRTMCYTCQSRKRREAYLKMEYREWDGKSFVTTFDDDKFFHDSAELEEYCEDNEVDAASLRLVICAPNKLWKIDSSIWEDIAPEEDDFLPKEVEEALTNLNKAIENAPAISWGESKFRTSYDYTPESLTNEESED